jgi:hypothetical protein
MKRSTKKSIKGSIKKFKRSKSKRRSRKSSRKTCRQKKMSQIFKEWKQGKLRIGKSDKIVKSHKQAIAIAISVSKKYCN